MIRRIVTLLFIAAAITLLPWWLRGLAAALVLLRLSAYNATIARGLWLRLGCPRPHYITRLALPGLVLSEIGSPSAWPGSGSEDAILGSSMPQNEEIELVSTATLLLSRHNLSSHQACDLLAVLRNEDGDYLLSAGKIRDIVGGNNAKVLGWVREIRPETQPAPQGQRPGYTPNSDGYLVKNR